MFTYIYLYKIIRVFFQVDRLVDRISSATLLDDRRDAVRAIKSLSKVRFKGIFQ